MTQLLKKIYFLFIDQYAFVRDYPHFKKFIITIRHKFAGKNIYLSKNERLLGELKDIHLGKRCFIIGNGPSLNQLDLTKLKDEFTFGVNAIYLNYEKMLFHPTYYAVEDNFVAEDRKLEIEAYDKPKYKFFGNYLRSTINKDDKTIYINLLRNYKDKKNFPQFSENCNRRIFVGGSVTYVCLQLAYHMGFKEVYMIGFDHNYKIPESVEVTNKRETGFDILSTEDDVNHFHKDYFGKGYRWHDPNVERMEVGFRKAKEIYEKNNRKIYNSTKGGHLEVFERFEYDAIPALKK